MAWNTGGGEHFIALNPSNSLAASVAVAAGGTTLLGGGWALLPPPSGGDDTAMLNNVITALGAGGGEVWGSGSYRGVAIVLASYVLLKGPNVLHSAYGGSPQGFFITATGTGYIIDTPASNIFGCGVEGVHLIGAGSGTVGGGIRFQNVTKGSLRNVSGHNFANEAIVWKSACGACTLEKVYVAGIANEGGQAAIIGCVDLDGNDHYIDRVEATLEAGAGVSSGSLFCCAIVVRGSNMRIGSITGEFADQGVYVSGSNNRFVNADADHNWGHGFNVLGTGNLFTSCWSASNSQDTTNTYDNYRADTTASNNRYVNCKAANGLAKKAKYDFEDLFAGGFNNGNKYLLCTGDGLAATATYVMQNSGSVFELPNTPQGGLYAATVNIDVSKGNYAEINVTDVNAFTIAAPTNWPTGQVLYMEIINSSGGVMGAITWNAIFALRDTSFVAPANGKRRTIAFLNRGNGQAAQLGAASGDM